MIRLSKTENWALIKQIVTDPEVYPFVSDDESPLPEYWQPSQAMTHCLVTDSDEVLGVWLFHKLRAAVYEIHTCFLKNARGKKAYEALKLLPGWAWSNLKDAQRMVTEVPEYNRPALVFSLKAGMEKYGVNPRSFLKAGVLHDVILLGISRGEKCQ